MGHMEPEGTGAGNVTLTIVTTMAILNVTTTFTITTGGGMLVFGQGWSVLIIPILLFAGLVVLIVIGKKLR
jgi:sirohydrochlorin ferrochelatase